MRARIYTRKHTPRHKVFLGKESDQESTEKQLQAWRRGIPRYFKRPCTLEQLHRKNCAGFSGWHGSYCETASPGLRLRQRRLRESTAGLACTQNGNGRFLPLRHRHVLAVYFCLRRCALTRVRMNQRASRNPYRAKACQAESDQ